MKSIHDFVVKDIDGNETSLSKFSGKTLLVVNVASKCGFTPQYEGLQKIYEKYKDKGLEILGFPANDFLWQEPGTDSEIKQFCSLNYGVTFPMFSKITVKGKKKHLLYKFLTEESGFDGDVKWNFQKYLADKDGKVVAMFSHKTEPESPEIISEIEKQIFA